MFSEVKLINFLWLHGAISQRVIPAFAVGAVGKPCLVLCFEHISWKSRCQ